MVCVANNLGNGGGFVLCTGCLLAKLRLALLGIAVAQIINIISKSQERWIIGQ